MLDDKLKQHSSISTHKCCPLRLWCTNFDVASVVQKSFFFFFLKHHYFFVFYFFFLNNEFQIDSIDYILSHKPNTHHSVNDLKCAAVARCVLASLWILTLASMLAVYCVHGPC